MLSYYMKIFLYFGDQKVTFILIEHEIIQHVRKYKINEILGIQD